MNRERGSRSNGISSAIAERDEDSRSWGRERQNARTVHGTRPNSGETTPRMSVNPALRSGKEVIDCASGTTFALVQRTAFATDDACGPHAVSQSQWERSIPEFQVTHTLCNLKKAYGIIIWLPRPALLLVPDSIGNRRVGCVVRSFPFEPAVGIEFILPNERKVFPKVGLIEIPMSRQRAVGEFRSCQGPSLVGNWLDEPLFAMRQERRLFASTSIALRWRCRFRMLPFRGVCCGI